MSLDATEETRRARRRSRFVFGLTTLLLGVVEAVLLATPALQRLWDEYQLQLPTLTKDLVRVHRVAPYVVLGWWVVLAMNRQAKWSRRVALVISRVSLVVAFVLAGAAVMAVALTPLSLLEGLSK